MVFKRFYYWFIKLNIFNNEESLSLSDRFITTRLFLFLFIISNFILILFNGLTLHTYSTTIQSPSISHFEYLNHRYENTLNCPCSQPNIVYNEIISFSPKYHQLCSSDFIRDDRWLMYYAYVKKPNEAGINYFYRYDFSSGAGLNLFYLMETLCTTAEETVYNAYKQFDATQLVSSNAISRDLFEQKTNAVIEQFQNETQYSFHTLFSKLRAAIENNQLVGLSDGKVEFRSSMIDQTMGYRYIFSLNPNCSCAITNKCMSPMNFHRQCEIPCKLSKTAVKMIPGLFIGCSLLDSLLLSTLECFYDHSCIQMLLDYGVILTQVFH